MQQRPILALLTPLFSLLLWASTAGAQVIPAENALLRYRIIAFDAGAAPADGSVVLEIARGHITSNADFVAARVYTGPYAGSGTLAEVPDFNSNYTWRVGNRGKTATATLHYFGTANSPNVDTATNRMLVTHPAETHTDGFFFNDRTHALYNMQGKPVWYLPTCPAWTTKA